MKFITIAPISSNSNFEMEASLPIDMGFNVSIQQTPAWFNKITTSEHISALNARTKESVCRSELFFSVEYDGENFGAPSPLKDESTEWTIHDCAYEKITLANLALWLVSSIEFGFEFIIDLQEDINDWLPRQSRVVTPFVGATGFACETIFTKKQIVAAKDIFEVLILLERTGAVWIAISTLVDALKEKTWEVRYLLFWIAIEALFGPKEPKGELIYRISHYTALFLAQTNKESFEICKNVKKLYEWRSNVVHGMRLEKLINKQKNQPELSVQITLDTKDLLRRSLLRILSNSILLKKLNSDERENYLEELVLNVE